MIIKILTYIKQQYVIKILTLFTIGVIIGRLFNVDNYIMFHLSVVVFVFGLLIDILLTVVWLNYLKSKK